MGRSASLPPSPPPAAAARAEAPARARARALAGVGRALGAQRLDALRAARGLAARREVGRVQLRVEVGVGELVPDGHPARPDGGVAPEQVDSEIIAFYYMFSSIYVPLWTDAL